MSDSGNGFEILLATDEFLDVVVLLLDKVFVDADRVVVALGHANYVWRSIQPERRRFFTVICLCETWLLKFRLTEPGVGVDAFSCDSLLSCLWCPRNGLAVLWFLAKPLMSSE